MERFLIKANDALGAAIKAKAAEELQDFLEETGFISDGGVEPSFYPEGKRVDGTYEKKLVRMNPTTLTNEYCVGYYYDNKLVGVEPQNVVPTMSIGELVNALKKEGII